VAYVYGMDHSAEPDEDGGHVVAAQTGHGVLGEQFVESLLHDGPIVLPLTNFLLNDIY
jgi:hypothetical protein